MVMFPSGNRFKGEFSSGKYASKGVLKYEEIRET